jgi:hypothetical protein
VFFCKTPQVVGPVMITKIVCIVRQYQFASSRQLPKKFLLRDWDITVVGRIFETNNTFMVAHQTWDPVIHEKLNRADIRIIRAPGKHGRNIPQTNHLVSGIHFLKALDVLNVCMGIRKDDGRKFFYFY